MNSERLVSIVVPVYNAEKYLKKCIQSIMGQSYQELEIILVNDGSVDQSKMICEELMKLDSRICLINKKNEGAAEAKNVGIECANGAFIMFVDWEWLLFMSSAFLSNVCPSVALKVFPNESLMPCPICFSV